MIEQETKKKVWEPFNLIIESSDYELYEFRIIVDSSPLSSHHQEVKKSPGEKKFWEQFRLHSSNSKHSTALFALKRTKFFLFWHI